MYTFSFLSKLMVQMQTLEKQELTPLKEYPQLLDKGLSSYLLVR